MLGAQKLSFVTTNLPNLARFKLFIGSQALGSSLDMAKLRPNPNMPTF
jgi:hypothetical protein